jgi:hippurate hydrolase
MIAAGVLENPKVDACSAVHVMLDWDAPSYGCRPGFMSSSCDGFKITVNGKGCHGAMPELGIDPINIASHIVIALQELHARELSMSENAVLTIGTFQTGNANNVIPDTARLTGTLRAFDENVRKHIKLRLTEICTGISKTFRGRAEVTFTSGCPTLLNDDSLSKEISNYCKELLGRTMAFSQADLTNMAKQNAKTVKATGSEDFSYISQEIPSVMVAIAAGNSESGFQYPLHHPKVTFDETVLAYGAGIYAYTAIQWLEKHFNQT